MKIQSMHTAKQVALIHLHLYLHLHSLHTKAHLPYVSLAFVRQDMHASHLMCRSPSKPL